MIRKRALVAVALATALPFAFAVPAGAVEATGDASPGDLPAAYAGSADRLPPGQIGGTGRSADRELTGAAAGAPVDGSLTAVNKQLTALADTAGALGVYHDPAASEFVVVFPAGEAGASATELTTTAGAVRVVESSLPADTVDGFADEVAERAFHPAADEYSYGSYVDVVEDVIVLGTDAPAEVLASLVDGYGDAVQVRHGESGRLRHSDPQPHWGGASITSGGSVCTSGFAGQSGGTRVMVTAGHCFTPGASVTSTGGGQAWGTFLRHVNFPDPDLAIITGTTYQGAIYVGSAANESGAQVASFGDPVIGFNNYCFSGQTSGQVCGHTAVSNGGTLCDSAGCTFNMTVSNGIAAQSGDSGSPVFALTSGGGFPVHIRGIIIGVVAGQTYWHRYSQVTATGVTGVPYP